MSNTISWYINRFKRNFRFIVMFFYDDFFYIKVTRKWLLVILYFLKESLLYQFKSLIDITAIDYYLKRFRFELIYNLLSVFYNIRTLISVVIHEYPDKKILIPSCWEIFPNAVWYEREIWDLFGVEFLDSPDTRRILNDYGFEGHPLRKDFPVTGIMDLYYSHWHKVIIKDHASFSQLCRSYNLNNNWSNI